MYSTDWTITETELDPNRTAHQETVFTIGNGYLGTRGTFEEGYPGGQNGTWINGVYDKIPIAFTELANCPDWLPIAISIGGEYFSLDRGEILHYRRELDMRRGILRREIRWRSPQGKTLDLQFERFTSLAEDHVGAIRLFLTPLDFEDSIEIQAGINGYPDNHGVKHWKLLDQGLAHLEKQNYIDSAALPLLPSKFDAVWLHLATIHSNIELGMATQLVVKQGNGEKRPVVAMSIPGYPTLTTSVEARRGETVTASKYVTLYTSREAGNPDRAALNKLANLGDYETLRQGQVAQWEKLWHDCDIIIEGDPKAQLAIRYNLFQLLQASPRHDDRVSIPAKALSGFAYRGHIFWDTEIFILPFLSYNQPNIARNLLTYRYHTLPGARRKAAESGYEGAMFAWESADTGDEVTPRWVPDAEGKELVRIWCGDIELHITSDIAYAVWQYWKATGDEQWMLRYGAELMLDTAKFWGTRVEWNADRACYEIRDTIGPDEYHDHVDNNAFTNYLVQWHLETALSLWERLQTDHPAIAAELGTRLNLSEARLAKWADIVARIWVPFDPETKLLEQADGFFQLESIDLADYEPRQQSMQAILGIEGASRRQVLKQADVLMLLYLLGDRFDRETLEKNWDYYNPRTDHTYGSSLSPAIHAILACHLARPEEAYEHLMRAALVDLEDVRGNAGEGIHAASTGATWQAVVFGFGGLRFGEYGPGVYPHLPPGWTRLMFKVRYGEDWYRFNITPHGVNSELLTLNPMMSQHWPLLMPTIRGVLFDLDGVLTDTAEYHYRAWKRLADEAGIAFDRAANESMRGLSRRDSLVKLLGDRQVSEAQMQEMMDRKNQYYVESIAHISPEDLLPGTAEFLEELRNAGIKIAIASASQNARSVVERLGIASQVDAIADGYSVVRSKPAPDLFLHAAEQLGIDPSQLVVFEDADSGIQAAIAADMWAVALGPPERFQQSHLNLPSLSGVSWVTLQGQLAQVQRSHPTPHRTPQSQSSDPSVGNRLAAGVN